MESVEEILLRFIENKNLFISLSMLISVLGIFFIFILNSKKFKFLINKGVHICFNIFVIILIGITLNLLNIIPSFSYKYFHVFVFLVSIFLIILFLIIQLLIYGFKNKIFLQFIKQILYVFYFEIFLLSVSSNLDFLEITASMLIIVFFNFLSFVLNNLHKEAKKLSKELDFPNSELMYKRDVQLEKFIEILKVQKDEPYAIMINAKWGMGKTSFVQALEQRLEEDNFLWIEVGNEKSIVELMQDLSKMIINILKENNIYLESEGIIEQYFLTFSNYLQDGKFEFLNQIINSFEKNCDKSDKVYINSKLSELKTTIFLVVDDLDRCTDDYQDKLFKVLRESTNLNNCKTLFLVDKDQFNQKNLNYLDKYISYTLDLCEIECTEIIQFFVSDILTDDFCVKINEKIRKGRDKKSIFKMIIEIEEKILSGLGDELLRLESEISKNGQDESEIHILVDKKNKFDECYRMILINTKNVRKVKRFLKSIKYSIQNMNFGIENVSNTFQEKDWLEYILRVLFLKNFLPEIYNEIKGFLELEDYLHKNDNHFVKYVLGINDVLVAKTDFIILNELIYREDVINYSEVKLEKEKYLDELRSNDSNIKNINKYIAHVETNEDLEKIIEICLREENKNFEGRDELIKSLLKTLSKQSAIHNLEVIELFEISKKIITWLNSIHLSECEKNIVENFSGLIVRRVIVDNNSFLRLVLFYRLDVTTVQNVWKPLSVSNISEFYEILSQLDNKFGKDDALNDNDKFKYIESYYKKLIQELKIESNSQFNLTMTKYEEYLSQIFELCHLWLSKIEYLNDIDVSVEMTESKYFDLLYFDFKNEAFFNVNNLEEALKDVFEFLELHRGNYQSQYSKLLMRGVQQIILIYEKDSTWFKGRENVIGELLDKISIIAYELDPLGDKTARIILEQLRVFVYKFNKKI